MDDDIMELKIYDVAYYTKEYGEIKEISDMCQKLSDFVKNKSYSKNTNTIRVGPIAAPDVILQKGLWKEFNRVWLSTGDANISLHIDFNMYENAIIKEKEKLVINNVLASIKTIAKKGKIDYEAFKKDIIIFCQENQIEIDVEKL